MSTMTSEDRNLIARLIQADLSPATLRDIAKALEAIAKEHFENPLHVAVLGSASGIVSALANTFQEQEDAEATGGNLTLADM